MSSIRPIKILFAALLLLGCGLVRLPLEHAFAKELKTAELSEPQLNLSLRDELGQSFFIAVLGGFRSVVASLIEIENMDAWHQQNFAKVDAAYALCTKLQPREYHYWDFRAWMSAYNAFDHYKYEDLTRPGLKPWIHQNLIDHAIAVLKEGMIHIPDNYHLPQSIAMLTANFEKNQHANYYEASQWYYKAWQIRPERRFLWRNYVYNLAKAPGHELAAWPLLMEAYQSGPFNLPENDHTPSIRTHMASIFPVVKAALPDAVLPPDVAAEFNTLIEKEKARLERNRIRRERETRELKTMEDELLPKQPRPRPASAP